MRYALALCLVVSATVAAQQSSSPARALTAADYAHAERYLSYNTTPLVLRSGVRPTWLPDDRFWYRVTTESGSVAVLIDAAKATRAVCDLPACRERSGEAGRGGRGGAAAARVDVPSPDGKRTAFIRD